MDSPEPAPDLAQACRHLEDALRDVHRALRARSPRPTGGPLFEALRTWRAEQARAKRLPPYIIATDAVLRGVEEARPRSLDELQAIRGIGPGKAALYGEQILRIVASARE